MSWNVAIITKDKKSSSIRGKINKVGKSRDSCLYVGAKKEDIWK